MGSSGSAGWGGFPCASGWRRCSTRAARFLELGIWAAHQMYAEWGDVPAAGIVTGIGWVSGRPCLVAAHDATVKAGAMFPQSVKKLLACSADRHAISSAGDLSRRLGGCVPAAAG